jgi:hypothetical protein
MVDVVFDRVVLGVWLTSAVTCRDLPWTGQDTASDILDETSSDIP